MRGMFILKTFSSYPYQLQVEQAIRQLQLPGADNGMLLGMILGRTLYCNPGPRGKEYVLRAVTSFLENLLVELRRGELPAPSVLQNVTARTRKMLSRQFRAAQAQLADQGSESHPPPPAPPPPSTYNTPHTHN
jgi:hypothetical protein